ncbi:hypothetical protein Cflav_PD3084 [Pedosphaera parvula Ellin514]|uniref:Uncharacterized protein n=1 Tax=Pedosphaera parvula (strain Ellin514) TaxID=320771 RepID=B9XJG4_PEDPL|nr:hypothetical protein Cflav_PD3084 [Pedosphaera parvula Ellin514]
MTGKGIIPTMIPTTIALPPNVCEYRTMGLLRKI